MKAIMKFLKPTHAVALLMAVILVGFHFSPAGSMLYRKINLPLSFMTRDILGQAPQMDPRLKIYALDNHMVSLLQRDYLTMQSWVKILQYFDQYKPKAIFIDKVFGMPLRAHLQKPFEKSYAETIVHQLKGLDTPVVVGSFFSDSKIKYRTPMSTRKRGYELNRYHMVSDFSNDHPHWLPLKKKIHYGPHPLLYEGFSGIGHINLDHQDGYIDPFVSLAPGYGVPHTFLLTLGGTVLDHRNQLYVGGHKVPVNGDGQILVNFGDPNVFKRHTRSLVGVVQQIKSGAQVEPIGTDDYVLILPQMFAGNKDMHDSPVGKTPGGYFQIALHNSGLSGAWLNEPGWASWFLLPLLLVAWFIAVRLAPLQFFVSMSFGCLALMTAGVYFFSYELVSVPYLNFVLIFSNMSVVTYIFRTRMIHTRVRQIKESVNGFVAPELMDKINKTQGKLSLEPTQQVVTIMFVDVVKFSLAIDKMHPSNAFEVVRERIGELTEIILRHGGMIDKTLGDGILCFFGYDYISGRQVPNHADQALACAQEIQRSSLMKTLKLKEGSPILPLRIGINSATVFMGNVGQRNKIDYTLLGSGVNLASRLETACEPFRILVGRSTIDLSSYFARDERLIPKAIKIKHHQRLIPAYDLNPFFNEPKKLKEAMGRYWEFHNLEPSHRRYQPFGSQKIRFMVNGQEAELVDFSYGGLSLKLSESYGKGVVLKVLLKTDDKHSIPEWEALDTVVRWSRSKNMDYLHGCEIVNLSDRNKNLLLEYFLDVFSEAETQNRFA